MQSKNKEILVMGFALFAMFFGAGNVIFLQAHIIKSHQNFS